MATRPRPLRASDFGKVTTTPTPTPKAQAPAAPVPSKSKRAPKAAPVAVAPQAPAPPVKVPKAKAPKAAPVVAAPASQEQLVKPPKAPAKKTGRPALDPSGSLALHFRIPGNAGAALTRAAGSAPGARSALARRLFLAAMAQAGITFTSEDEGEGTLPLPFADVPRT